jgi:hypothetical protein
MENLRGRKIDLVFVWDLVVVYSLRTHPTVDGYRQITGRKNFPPRKDYRLALGSWLFILYPFITEFAREKCAKT